MTSDIREYPLHYSSLAIYLGIVILCLTYFWHQNVMQMLVAVFAATGYLVWGVIHHWLAGDLHYQIVLEYLTMSLLTLVVFAMILLV